MLEYLGIIWCIGLVLFAFLTLTGAIMQDRVVEIANFSACAVIIAWPLFLVLYLFYLLCKATANWVTKRLNKRL